MTPEDKALWIADLRANGHRQGRHALSIADPSDLDNQDLDRDCCLGRACKLFLGEPLNVWQHTIREDQVEWLREWRDYDDLAGSIVWSGLPAQLQERLGLTGPGWLHIADRVGDRVNLAGLNDDGLTFAQIADLIEYFF